jgi:hypothetical protein
MYRKLHLDFETLGRMHARALSDLAIGRVLGCSRQTIFNYRRRLGLASRWPRREGGRRRSLNLRARHAELDRLWARLSLAEKVALLLQGPEANAEEVKSRT